MISVKAVSPSQVKAFIVKHFDISVNDLVSQYQEGDWSYDIYTVNKGYELIVCSDQAWDLRIHARMRAHIAAKKILLDDGLEEWLTEEQIINEGISLKVVRQFAEVNYNWIKEVELWNKKFKYS